MKSSEQHSKLTKEKLKLCDDSDNISSKDNVDNNFEHKLSMENYLLQTTFPHLITMSLIAMGWFAIYNLTSTFGDQFLHYNQYIGNSLLTIYQNISNGNYKIECSIGSPPIQTAKCQLYQGVNLMFMHLVVQLSEFILQGAQMKNTFATIAFAAAVYKLCKNSVLQGYSILSNVVSYTYKQHCSLYRFVFNETSKIMNGIQMIPNVHTEWENENNHIPDKNS